MSIEWRVVVDLVTAVAWPAVVLAGVYLFRRPLADLVAQLARRARKLSVFEVSIELATLPQLQASWSVSGVDPRRLSSAQIFDSGSQALFQELAQPAHAEYAIVDLGSGEAWLTSRLFVFALILGEVAGLRAFVFLEHAGGTRRRFLGCATPSDVRKALGKRYPWLEEAFARALRNQYTDVVSPAPLLTSAFSNQLSPLAPRDQWSIPTFVRGFIEVLQRATDPPAVEKDSYLEIGIAPQTWERAQWINGERLERDLAGMLEYAWVAESPDDARISVADAVARRNASFVALVDDDRRFVALVDRHALLAQMSVARYGAQSKPDQFAS